MPETPHPPSGRPPEPAAQASGELQALASGAKRQSFGQVLRRPLTIVALVLFACTVALVFFLQQDPAALRLQRPSVQRELLQNVGRTEGLPVAIQLGFLTVFEINDPRAGGAGADRANRVIGNLDSALQELEESPGRVITIDSEGEEGMPRIVQKAHSDSAEALEIVQVTSDDLALARADDAKLLARVWAERLTDSFRLLLFGEPPEFSRDSDFGRALDTLYVNARAESGRLTTEALETAFEALPDPQRQALTSFPELPSADAGESPAPGGDQPAGRS